MNTFSKSLAPSIRISYMVLPQHLMEQFQASLGFYSCTVPSFEQYTLARFLEEGHFEKHINRMRKAYRSTRNRLLEMITHCPLASRFTIQEENAGLHFLLTVDTDLSGPELIDRCREMGIRIQTLAAFYHGSCPPDAHRTLVVNYAGLRDEDLCRLETTLSNA
jgi:GntR family transcriptional regulator/MocR family aminotransferase